MATIPEQATALEDAPPEQAPPKDKTVSRPIDTLFDLRKANGDYSVWRFTRWLCDADDAYDAKLDRSRDVTRLSKHSYLAGLAGTLALLGMGFLASRRGVFGKDNIAPKGWGIGGGEFDNSLAMIFVLLVVSVVMFAVEVAIRLDVDKGRIVKLAPDVKEGRWSRFIAECLLVYGVEIGLFGLIYFLFETANEYGFQGNRAGYYKPWFAVMPYFWKIYLYGGLPYVLLTRAFQHAPRSDRRQAAFAIIKVLRRLGSGASMYAALLLAGAFGIYVFKADGGWQMRALVEGPGLALGDAMPQGWQTLFGWLVMVIVVATPVLAWFTNRDEETQHLDHYDRSAFLGLCVKIFFVPLMTVFFIDQYTHLVRNYDWMTGPNFAFGKVNLRDVHNVSHSVIFSVDVGLAWCGYVVSSRWIKNTLFSTEPSFLGWMMALFCYPPINRIPGFYYGSPGETEFFSITHPGAVTFFAVCSILSFAVYTSATVCFGLRFSNLTHRGIITTGPYAYIRHPAYAAKNFSWWCVMLPAVVWEVFTLKEPAVLLHVIGMIVMSFIYYMRAITEERHLARDPEYRIYMKKVPYRFIPGVL